MHRPVVVVVTNVSVWVARVGCHQSQPASVTVKNTMQLQIVLTREEGRRAFRILVPTIHSMDIWASARRIRLELRLNYYSTNSSLVHKPPFYLYGAVIPTSLLSPLPHTHTLYDISLEVCSVYPLSYLVYASVSERQ